MHKQMSVGNFANIIVPYLHAALGLIIICWRFPQLPNTLKLRDDFDRLIAELPKLDTN